MKSGATERFALLLDSVAVLADVFDEAERLEDLSLVNRSVIMTNLPHGTVITCTVDPAFRDVRAALIELQSNDAKIGPKMTPDGKIIERPKKKEVPVGTLKKAGGWLSGLVTGASAFMGITDIGLVGCIAAEAAATSGAAVAATAVLPFVLGGAAAIGSL